MAAAVIAAARLLLFEKEFLYQESHGSGYNNIYYYILYIHSYFSIW